MTQLKDFSTAIVNDVIITEYLLYLILEAN